MAASTYFFCFGSNITVAVNVLDRLLLQSRRLDSVCFSLKGFSLVSVGSICLIQTVVCERNF